MLPPEPKPFRIDNQSAIRVAKSNDPTKHRKFIDLRHHYLAHHTKKKTIDIKHVPTTDMLLDLSTMLLTPAPFLKLCEQLNVCLRTPLPAHHITHKDASRHCDGGVR